jgi:hypothetical protein
MTSDGAAFPVNTSAGHEDGAFEPHPGMTLRDWFAGQALAGLLGNAGKVSNEDGYAQQSYMIADAMLAARKQEQARG